MRKIPPVVGGVLVLVGGIGVRIWWQTKGLSQVTFLVLRPKPYLVSFFPQKKRLVRLNLPPNLLIEVGGGYGEYRLQALPRLAALEHKPYLVSRAVSLGVGVLVDKTVTTLPIFWRFWSWQWEKVEAESSNWLTKVSLPDGQLVYRVLPARAEAGLAPYFADPGVRESNLTFGCYNLGDTRGLAKKAAGLVKILGGQVLAVGNKQGEREGRCLILADRGALAWRTGRRLAKALACKLRHKLEEGGANIEIWLW